jgi:hypothetical protein
MKTRPCLADVLPFIILQSFGGSIPTSIGRLDSLELLRLNDNDFTGFIPNSLGRLRQLQVRLCDNHTSWVYILAVFAFFFF